MQLPFFYNKEADKHITTVAFNEDASRHMIQVLRMKTGDLINVTNGRGDLFTATITRDHKKNCEASITKHEYYSKARPEISVAISLLKNQNRFEWFLEKTTELGVHNIIPLLCDRTEKQHYKEMRLQNIIVSAMLQSQQVWLPQLYAPMTFEDVINNDHFSKVDQKFIAHCAEGNKQPLRTVSKNFPAIVLIGPEGDFNMNEIDLAIGKGYHAVSLGNTRLRTETAGVVAASLLCI